MSSETELKLSPEEKPREKDVRDDCKCAFEIKQFYVIAHGKHAPGCIRIRRIGKNHYLELSDPAEKRKKKRKRKRFWRSKLSSDAWERVKTGAEVLRVRRSEAIEGDDKGQVFYAVTVKEEVGKKLKRHEWERPIPRWAYKLLKKDGTHKRKGRRMIRKNRYYVKEKQRVIHVDFFRGRHKGLVLLEIEFGGTRSAKKFRREHGKKKKQGIVYKERPKFIKGACLDVTGRRSAGCRTLSGRSSPPSFW